MMSAVLRVLVIDPSRVHRDGIAALLHAPFGAGQVETAPPEGALAAALEQASDVALVRLEGEEGWDTLRALARGAPACRVVALGMRNEEEALAFLEAGGAGYLAHDAGPDELERTITAVARDETPCSPRVAGAMRRRLAALAAEYPAPPALAALTPRERVLLDLVELGLSNKEISRRLNVTVATVKNHLHNAFRKLGVRRRGQASARVRALRAARPGP